MSGRSLRKLIEAHPDYIGKGLAVMIAVWVVVGAWAISADAEPALSSFGPSPQAVSAVPASIAYREGDG